MLLIFIDAEFINFKVEDNWVGLLGSTSYGYRCILWRKNVGENKKEIISIFV